MLTIPVWCLILMDSQAKGIHMTRGEHKIVQLALGYLKSIAAPQLCKSQQFQHGNSRVIPHQTCGTQGFWDGKECKTASQFQWECCHMDQSSGRI